MINFPTFQMFLSRRIANSVFRQVSRIITTAPRAMSHKIEDPDQLNAKYVKYFNRCNIDAWQVRKGMNDILGYDFVPDPPVIIAALRACRRVNDYAISIRFLEAIKDKCGSQVDLIYPYIACEIRPTLKLLGCDLPETLGYHKPELFTESVFDM
uniref:Cytochrome c oxidase subunit 5A, mitochondrial n=1 Tax=Epicauta chinensis TaxID=941254 RepID=A0A8U0DA81_9CUCU|nr:mitochondrial cytochrome c oxidase subunit 5A [Epicauta chinensis]